MGRCESWGDANHGAAVGAGRAESSAGCASCRQWRFAKERFVGVSGRKASPARGDIRSSIASATGTAGGVTLTVELRLMLSGITLPTDNVFRDGVELEVPSIAGDVDAGYAVRLDVAIPLG